MTTRGCVKAVSFCKHEFSRPQSFRGRGANRAAIPTVRRSRSARSCRACGGRLPSSHFVSYGVVSSFSSVSTDEHGQQLRGFGLARVLTNAVPITGHLGEALPGAIRNDRSIIDRTLDGSFENGCVDKS